MNRLLQAIGKAAYSYRKTVLAVWLVFVLMLSVFAVQLPSVLKGSGFVMEGSFATVNTVLQEEFGIAETVLMLVYEQKAPGQQEAPGEQEALGEPANAPDRAALEAFIAESLQSMQALDLEGFANVSGPVQAEGVTYAPDMIEGNVAYAAISFTLPTADMNDNIARVRMETERLAARGADNGIVLQLSGAPIIEADLNKASQDDLTRAEMIGIPVAMVVLLFAFGGLVAASLPLIVGLISVVSTMGVLYFFGLQMELSVFLLNVVVMLGLALGIDFALLFVNRFRQELQRRGVQEAIRISVMTAGESIIFSGLCVFIGLAGMLFIQIDIFKVIALGGMTVVFFSILSALTLLPAVLALLGERVNKLMVLKPRAVARESGWLRFARLVMRRPGLMAICAFAILLLSMLPIRQMELRVPGTDALPPGYESREAFEKYEQVFTDPDTSDVVLLATTAGEVTEPEALAALERVTAQLKEDPQVQEVVSLFSLAGDLDAAQWSALYSSPETAAMVQPIADQLVRGSMTLIEVKLNTDQYSEATKQWVRAWSGEREGVELQVGGYAKFNQEIFDEIYAKIGYSLAFILGATYLILFLAFRSIFIPLKAIVMNVISLGATFGLVVWIFQDGLFGVDPTSIALFIPIFIFSIVFGLSTDYEVFLISRIQEIYRETGDNDQATLEGLTLTSKIITSAAAIMIVITGAFAFTGVMPVKQLGVGIALAIFIDATIVRMVLVPSMMKLLGRWNWWAPRWLQPRRQQPAAGTRH